MKQTRKITKFNENPENLATVHTHTHTHTCNFKCLKNNETFAFKDKGKNNHCRERSLICSLHGLFFVFWNEKSFIF